MNIKKIKVSDLRFDPNQTRIHTKRNLEAIRCSLKEHGQVETLLVRVGHNYVISGNGRLEVMRELGWTEVYCNVIELNDKQAKRLSIRMNRSGELAQWDEIELAKQIKEAMDEGEKSDSLGFSKDESDRLVAKLQQTLEAMQPPDDFMEESGHDIIFDEDTATNQIEQSQNDQSVSDGATRQSHSDNGQNSESQRSEQTTELTKDALYFFVEFYGQKKRFVEITQKLNKALATPNKINSDEFEKMVSLYYRYLNGQ